MKKVLLEAPILTQSGYGEHSRFVYRSLKKRKDIDLYIIPLGWGSTSWVTQDDEERKEIDFLVHKTTSYAASTEMQHYDIHIHVGIPNEFSKKAPYAIHVTAGIETTKISSSWLEKTFEMDKIIVPSEHSKWAFDNTTYKTEHGQSIGCNTPVEVVPYPVKEHDKEEIDINLDYDFNFLSVALWCPRKNMHNMITWFMEEFVNDEVGLVLKTGISRGSYLDRKATELRIKNILEQYPNRKCKVYLMHGTLSEGEMKALYTHKKIKAMISSTHGEGFGLPLFEAAINALPVVAPGWGGHVDFMNAPVRVGKNQKTKKKDLYARVDYTIQPVQKEAVWQDIIIPESMWCFPTERSFKEKIRKVYKDYGVYKGMAKKLKSHVIKEYSEQKMFEKMSEAILSVSVSESIEDQLAALTVRDIK